MKLNCGMPAEHLIGHADNELRGALGEYVEAHVRNCSICQEELRALDETRQMLLHHTSKIQIDDGIAELKQLISEWQPNPDPLFHGLLDASSRALEAGRFRVNLARFGIPTLLILGLILIAQPTLTQADFGFRDIVRDILPGTRAILPEGERPPGTPLREQELSPFIAPTQLPEDLELYHAFGDGPGYLELRYQNDLGIELMLIQTSLDTQFEVYTHRSEIVSVSGVEVLAVHDSRLGAVGVLVWERRDVRFSLLPVRVPQGQEGGLQLDDGLAIVKAVIEVQDDRKQKER